MVQVRASLLAIAVKNWDILTGSTGAKIYVLKMLRWEYY